MPKSKKTISVSEVLNWANDNLTRTDGYATQEFKAGICTMLERQLLDTGNYMGYRYLTPDLGRSGEFNREYYLK